MIGEDLPVGGNEKPGTKNIQVYFQTIAGKAQEWIVVFIGRWLATACQANIVQPQSGGVVAEGQHNVDKTDTRLIGTG